ncbi:SCO family protein [Rhodotorula paludigena]|uniref:SCO family protein n=1 Tax=Rhodotorula paludigena TaxID=86838 RepID=UPI003171EF64
MLARNTAARLLRTAAPPRASLPLPLPLALPSAAAPLARRSYTTAPHEHSPADANPTQSSSAQTQNRSQAGPFTLKAGALFLVTGVGLYFYFESEKQKLQERKRQETAAARVGRPKIGGPFQLTDQNGNTFSDKDLLGKWSMVYFGFTNCPDICPEELDKMTTVVESISKSHKTDILPVFITCDPARDDVKAVKTYVKDFHPSLVGLTGPYDDIKKTCKAYRVYFSTPPNAKPTDDYLVDHSIFFYLMDPRGKFVDAFGRSMGAPDVVSKVGAYLDEWREGGERGSWSEGQ